MRKRLITATLFVSLLLVSSYGFAQVNSVLNGTVSDASGALIPGVEVTAKNINTGITASTITNETGNFNFPSLQPGKYTLSAALSGFQTAKYDNVDLGSGQVVRLNFTLQVGAAAQNVEVTIAADTLLATTSASVGNVLPEKDLLSLPLSTRNVLDVLASTAGVVYTTNAFGAQVPNFGGTSVGSVNTTRDGLTTNDGRYNSSNGAYSAIFTSPDMVEEVRVSSNNIDPALGRGAAQVQMRTRAGTNDFHGAGFYSNNNSFLNSQTYFQNLQHAQKNYANRNQFGGRLGGPIIKNKMFFFVLTDDQRYMGKITQNTVVLTDLARQGIFRYDTTHRNGAVNSTQPSIDVNGNPLNPANIRSFNLFSDVKDPNRTGIDQSFVAKYYLANMPSPNNYQCAGITGAAASDGLNTGCYQWLQPQNGSDGATGQSPNTNRNHLTARYDYQINSKNKVTFTMTREKNWGVTGQTGLADLPAGGFGDVYRTPNFYTVGYTSTLSATLLNEFRFGRKRDTWLGTSPLDKGCCLFGAGEADRTSDAQKLYDAYPHIDKSFLYPSMPGGLAYINNFGVASPRITTSPFTQWADTLSFTKGAHSFSVGAEMDFTSSHAGNTGNTQTTRPEAFIGINSGFPSPLTTSQPYATGLNSNDLLTANNILATLSGSINNVQETFYINSPTQQGWTDYTSTIFFSREQHENDWNLFFKDNWKATKNLTLIFGLRYDKYGVVYDSFGLAGRYTSKFGSGAAALFGCSGSSFAVMFQPGAGDCGTANPSATSTEFVGKGSPNPDKLVHPNDWNNFAPSLGFSWAVPGLRNTVVRGGYGINYSAAPDFLAYNSALGAFPGNALNVTTTNFGSVGYLDLVKAVANQKTLFPLSTSGSVPFQPLPFNGNGSRTASISGYADNWKTPYVESFNLSIQRELTHNFTFDVGWVGNHAVHLQQNHNINDVNIMENGFLTAFNAVRAGADNVPLMDQIFKGVTFTNVGTVGTAGLTAAQALRRSTSTNGFIANGNVGGLANFINRDATLSVPAPNSGKPGDLLLNGNLPQNFFVVSPQYGTVNLIDQYGNSTYHSLQTHVTMRPTHGLGGQFSYTFSKALGNDVVRDPRNLALSKTVLGVDRTHVIASNVTYELPFGSKHAFLANAPGWADRIIGGWQLSSITSWQSGAPLSFNGTNTVYNAATNTVDQLAAMPAGQLVKGANYVSFFDTLKTVKNAPVFNADNATLQGVYTNQVLVDANGNTIMQNASPGVLGTMSSNAPTIRGPGMLSFNGALSKTVRISEGKTFNLRMDVVNVLNKPQWGNPNTNINGSSFGRITSVIGNQQRLVTLNARIDF
jgi:carboxypeptidase family protein/TonB-dependent receptor-like protein